MNNLWVQLLASWNTLSNLLFTFWEGHFGTNSNLFQILSPQCLLALNLSILLYIALKPTILSSNLLLNDITAFVDCIQCHSNFRRFPNEKWVILWVSSTCESPWVHFLCFGKKVWNLLVSIAFWVKLLLLPNFLHFRSLFAFQPQILFLCLLYTTQQDDWLSIGVNLEELVFWFVQSTRLVWSQSSWGLSYSIFFRSLPQIITFYPVLFQLSNRSSHLQFVRSYALWIRFSPKFTPRFARKKIRLQ